MRFSLYIFVIFLFSLVFTACQTAEKLDVFGLVSKKKSSVKLEGKVGDLLLVATEDFWASALSDSLKSMLEIPMQPALQLEPRLNLYSSSYKNFYAYQSKRRNVLAISFSDKQENTKVLRKKTAVLGQCFYQIDAPTVQALLIYTNTHKDSLVGLFETCEKQRLLAQVQENYDANLYSYFFNRFGLGLYLPQGSFISIEEENFVFLQRNRSRSLTFKDVETKKMRNQSHDVLQGFMIYRLPYKDTADFHLDHIIAKRDSLLKKIPLEKENAYFYTLYKDSLFNGSFYDPKEKNVWFKGAYAKEVRGIFQSKNYNMGGMFIALYFLSADKKYMIALDAYVYAPKFGKREYLRELESILYASE